MTTSNRRYFLKSSVIGATSLGIAPNILLSKDGISPSNRVQVGLIGCRNRGMAVLRTFLNHGGVDCVGLCDVDTNVLEEHAGLGAGIKAVAVSRCFSIEYPSLRRTSSVTAQLT